MEFEKERDMREAVTDWLVSEGYLVGYEIGVGGLCDIVAGRYGKRPSPGRKPPLLEIIAVELKLTRIAEVIDQARINAYNAHQSYAAMPHDICCKMQAATEKKFRSARIGLLSVSPTGVDVRISPLIYTAPPCTLTRDYRPEDHRYLELRLWAKCRKQYVDTPPASAGYEKIYAEE